MSEPIEPVPQRIGDADRDQAAALLRDALAEGRLDNEEFDQRIKALTAKTADDLEPLFRDLPGPKPGTSVAPVANFQAPPWQARPGSGLVQPTPAHVPAERSHATRALAVVASISWPIVIITLFATSWSYWWLIFIPIFLSSMAGGSRHREREERHP